MRSLCARTSLSGLAISTRDLSTSASAFTSIENESASAGVSRPMARGLPPAVASASALLSKDCGRRAPISPLRVVHGMLFFAWLIIFLIQSRLIATGNIALHRRVGVAAGFIPALMIPVAYATCVAMVRRKFDLIQYGAELAKFAVSASCSSLLALWCKQCDPNNCLSRFRGLTAGAGLANSPREPWITGKEATVFNSLAACLFDGVHLVRLMPNHDCDRSNNADLGKQASL